MSTNPTRYAFAGHVIELFASPKVFKPTLTTTYLIEQMAAADVQGRTVLDLGCGAAPISIAAAMLGARQVYASDIMPEACELAERNAIHNRVADKITVLNGDLFESVEGMKFDVIVDDVSGVAEDVAKVSSWFPPQVPLGGADGTEQTVKMLRHAGKYLNPGGSLLFPVLSLSRSENIVSVARDVVGDRLQLVASKLIPFNQELKDNLAILMRLRDSGLIHFEQIRSRLLWKLDIYRARAT